MVGDSAGREHDFSAADYAWALNAKIPFQTESQFFYGKEEELNKEYGSRSIVQYF